MLGFEEYQEFAKTTVDYPKVFKVIYPMMGLTGEWGEFNNKYKKVIRDGITIDPEDAKSELGDVLWYLSMVATDMGFSLEEIALMNVEKLSDRQKRNVIHGSGDTR